MIGALRPIRQRLLGSAQQSWYRLLLASTRRNSWDRFAFDVPLRAYGAGSLHPFSWYFSGQLATPARSVDDLSDWLRGCSYRRDAEQFKSADHWQHPTHFERRREGDCEDFSLWTWRKLVEMGCEAEFVAGWIRVGVTTVGHTWVQYREAGQTLVFDPVVRDPDAVVRPVAAVAPSYIPQVSVDQTFQGYVYGGYMTALHARWKDRAYPSIERDDTSPA
jgi:hypothetical protein